MHKPRSYMLPVSIITGFLGSGKTTLLNRLLQHASLGNTLVIVNEFGSIGIDHLLIAAREENVRLLANGCLCCKVRDDFAELLLGVAEKRASGRISFGRIVIETSGLADPVPLIRTLVTDDRIRRLYVLDTVLCMLDAVNCLNHLETMHEARKQLVVSDVQMLSKLDLVAREVVADIERAVAAMTKGTSVHLLPHEEPDPSFLFRGANSGKAGACIVHASPPGFRSIASAAASGAHHTAEISSFSTVCDGRTSASELATWLSMLASLRGQALLRVKGIVNVGGRPYAIDVVQNVIHEPTPLERWPDSDERTRLVIIAKGLNRHATERLVSSLSMVDSFSDATKIDPAAYHRFRETAEYILRG